ncbi:HIT family protein [Candidatus Saccharibacteria bacterium]|nr:HIT family protein [Candidatus Saccharibacteria bacterium]
MNSEMLSGNTNSAVDFLGNSWSFECVGCAIASGEVQVPGGILYEGEHILLVTDAIIPIPGFLIVQAKRHVNSFAELRPEERKELDVVLVQAERALKELGVTSEVTLVQEERSKHFHVWVFPTHEWMLQKFGKGVKYLGEIIDYAKNNASEDDKKAVVEVAEKVKGYLQNLR